MEFIPELSVQNISVLKDHRPEQHIGHINQDKGKRALGSRGQKSRQFSLEQSHGCKSIDRIIPNTNRDRVFITFIHCIEEVILKV